MPTRKKGKKRGKKRGEKIKLQEETTKLVQNLKKLFIIKEIQKFR